MNDALQKTLDALDGVRENGSGWVARCSAHDDNSPSLSIGTNAAGAVLLNCHAGCETEAILKAAGLEYADLYPDGYEGDGAATPQPAPRPQPPQEPPKPEPKGVARKEVEAWNSVLLDGEKGAHRRAREYLVEHRGIDPKLLRRRRVGLRYDKGIWWIVFPLAVDREAGRVTLRKERGFDPGALDWKRDDSGTPFIRTKGGGSCLVVMAREDVDGPLLVTAGETCGFSARSNGFNVAFGSAGESTFKDEWAGEIAGLEIAERGVVVCYDGDETGRENAPKVARKLTAEGVPVRIAHLPDGKDVNDVLTGEGGPERLREIVAEATPYQPPAAHGDDAAEAAEATRDASDVSEAAEAGGESAFTLENAPPLPDDVFDGLPALLREPSFMFGRRHKRDVFLTSALGVISGCLPNFEGYYGADVPGALGANLYGAVVAKTAGGKSALKWGRRLVREVDQAIQNDAETERADWKERKRAAEDADEDFDEREPPERSLFVPSNSSAAWLFRCLKDRGERGVLYSSEIDTITNAVRQEWGGHDTLLRQAYHHERADYGRKGEGVSHVLESPCVSAVLSGTPDQFARLMAGSVENGLYNRFLLYYFDAPEPWRVQRPTAAGIERVERLDELAKKAKSLFVKLDGRTDALRFEMDAAHWERRRDVFAPLLRKARLLGTRALEGVVFRAGVWAFRITMTLTALRAFENGAQLGRASTLSPALEDVEAGLSLASVYADHALRFGTERLNDAPPDPRMKRIRTMLGTVSEEEEFASGEAYRAYEVTVPKAKRKSRRTLRRDLKYAERQRLIEATGGNGNWRQINPADEKAAVSDVSDVSDWRESL